MVNALRRSMVASHDAAHARNEKICSVALFSPPNHAEYVHLGIVTLALSAESVLCPAGVVLPLLQQSVMFFNLGLSRFVLKKDLKWEQIAGAMLVVAGVIAAAWPSESGGGVFAQVRLLQLPWGCSLGGHDPCAHACRCGGFGVMTAMLQRCDSSTDMALGGQICLLKGHQLTSSP